jgi:hypothetical protein
MTKLNTPRFDLEAERDLGAQCLAVKMAGQTWHVPFDSLPVVPRVGETIRLADGSAGKVVEVEYELAPEGAPVDVAREMPAGMSYARPVRIVIRLA